MTRAAAPAKINLALVVGPRRENGRHEIATLIQRVDLSDRVTVTRAREHRVDGFAADTIVHAALNALAEATGAEAAWQARIEKVIPVAAGLGGGSSDAATALRLANATLEAPLPPDRLHDLARGLGSDVPFFLAPGPQLATGDGTTLKPVDLPQDYVVLLALPHDARKESTAAVYARFAGAAGFDDRRGRVAAIAASGVRPRDLAALPRNDLASSPLARELEALGAFRSDVSGAGPTVYALFHHRAAAEDAARRIGSRARVWITIPAWYG